jgi:hypothetical protein
MIILRSCVIDNKVLNRSQLIERVNMTKGQRAGDGPIAVEVEKDKSYYWCACGQVQKNNHSVMALIKVQNLHPSYIKQKKQKKCFFVHANKQMVSLFVMVHTTKSNIEIKIY